jgi:TPR repeat protein
MKKLKKYYLMAIDKGNNAAMYNLGWYYHFIEKNYDEAKKYYLMAIDKGNSDNAMINLKILGKIIEEENKKKFFEKINDDMNFEMTHDNNCCTICKCEKKILIDLNCDEKYNHYYCRSCINKWYGEHEHKCLLCYSKIYINHIKALFKI